MKGVTKRTRNARLSTDRQREFFPADTFASSCEHKNKTTTKTMSDKDPPRGKHYGDRFTRAKRSWKYGVPMDPGEDDWEGNEPSREELMEQYGSDYDSAKSFCDDLSLKSDGAELEPNTFPHPLADDWYSIATQPPKFVGPVAHDEREDRKSLKEIVQNVDFMDPDLLTLTLEEKSALSLEAKKDLDSIETPKKYLDASQTLEFMKRCKRRYKKALRTHHQAAKASLGTNSSVNGDNGAKRMKMSARK